MYSLLTGDSGYLYVQLNGELANNAQWLEADEAQGAVGVEELAVNAVLQMQNAGWDVARDLQVRSLLGLVTPIRFGVCLRRGD